VVAAGSRSQPSHRPIETDVQERAQERRGGERTRACRPQELIQRDAGARPRQIDRPHIMKRRAGKKVTQWQPFELLCRDLGHGAVFVALPLLFFDSSRIAHRTEAVDESSTASRSANNSSRMRLGRSRRLA
jgi:hypothetical protein